MAGGIYWSKLIKVIVSSSFSKGLIGHCGFDCYICRVMRNAVFLDIADPRAGRDSSGTMELLV